MNDLPDYDLERPYVETPPEEPRPPRGRWIVWALLVMAIAAALYITFAKRSRPTPVGTLPARAGEKEPARSLGRDAEPVAVPPLDESDPLVRTLVRALSDHPVVAAWLTTNGLIRNFTAAVTNVADGVAPAKQLDALRSAAEFRVLERGGISYIDPRSYDRYTGLADAVASVDPVGAAKLYATLKPRIEQAFAELGFPDRRFSQVLEQAIVALLRTPTQDGPLEIKPNDAGVGYVFADGRLERLSEAQKPLLRMGPRNARIIKTKLREIAVALGIPPDRLPD